MPFLFPNKVLTEGMRSAVSCQILEGNLPIAFHWKKNGRRLVGGATTSGTKNIFGVVSGGTISNVNGHRQGVNHFGISDAIEQVSIRANDEYSSTLVIDRLAFGHRGNYTCTATNAAGTSSHTAELTVNGKPMAGPPEKIFIVVGSGQ